MVPILTDIPGQPSWFTRSASSWLAILVILHPDRAVRDRAWSLLENEVTRAARHLYGQRGTKKRIGVMQTADVLESMSGELFTRQFRHRPGTNWELFIATLETAMKPVIVTNLDSVSLERVQENQTRAKAAVSDLLKGTYTPWRGSGHVEPFLYTVMKNTFYDAARWLTRRAHLSIDQSRDERDSPGLQLADSGPTPDAPLIIAEAVESLMRTLDVIPDDRRFRIRFFLLMTCDWDLWQRVPAALRHLCEEDREALGLSQTEEFPSREFCALDSPHRQREIECRLLNSEIKRLQLCGQAADESERKIREKVQKWKNGGLHYLRSELRDRSPQLGKGLNS